MQEIIERLVRIEERQMAVKEQLSELDEKLFGNGQPGIIALLSERVNFIERRVWIWIGTGIGLSVALSLFGLWVNWGAE